LTPAIFKFQHRRTQNHCGNRFGNNKKNTAEMSTQEEQQTAATEKKILTKTSGLQSQAVTRPARSELGTETS
jgi:hypothetical protein